MLPFKMTNTVSKLAILQKGTCLSETRMFFKVSNCVNLLISALLYLRLSSKLAEAESCLFEESVSQILPLCLSPNTAATYLSTIIPWFSFVLRGWRLL